MNRCEGTTHKGDRCKRKIKSPYKWCPAHDTNNSDSECLICFSPNSSRSVRCEKCDKLFHERCIARMFRCECPHCRESLEKVVQPETLNKIRKNKEEKDDEENEEFTRPRFYISTEDPQAFFFLMSLMSNLRIPRE